MQYVWAFIVGGLLCVIAQILIDRTKLTPARILVTYVVAGVVLTAVGVYEPLIELAGSGAATPLSGFGYLLAPLCLTLRPLFEKSGAKTLESAKTRLRAGLVI